MNKVFIGILSVVIIVAFSLLVYASKTGTTQVFIPSELIAETNKPRRLRLIGRVKAKDMNYSVKPSFLLEFNVGDPKEDNDKMIKVTYAGIKPDMFQEGRDVIIDGEYIGNNSVKAASLLTQCPSKYEAPAPNQN